MISVERLFQSNSGKECEHRNTYAAVTNQMCDGIRQYSEKSL